MHQWLDSEKERKAKENKLKCFLKNLFKKLINTQLSPIDRKNLSFKQRNTMLKTNEYFDGNVKSIAFQTETLPATVGVMAVGDYIFSTVDNEKMMVVSGKMTIKLGNSDKKTYISGESFDVPANTSFDVTIAVETAYLCLYG